MLLIDPSFTADSPITRSRSSMSENASGYRWLGSRARSLTVIALSFAGTAGFTTFGGVSNCPLRTPLLANLRYRLCRATYRLASHRGRPPKSKDRFGVQPDLLRPALGTCSKRYQGRVRFLLC